MAHTTQAAAPKRVSPPTFIGGIEVIKIVRTHVGIEAGGTQSFGAMVDATIAEALVAGDEIQRFTVEINEDHWNAMRRDRTTDRGYEYTSEVE